MKNNLKTNQDQKYSYIPLTCGMFVKVDVKNEEDIYNHFTSLGLNEIVKSEYARGYNFWGDRVYLSRAIMNAPDYMEVDFLDGDTLNCTEENLYICSHLENAKIKKLRQDGYTVTKQMLQGYFQRKEIVMDSQIKE